MFPCEKCLKSFSTLQNLVKHQNKKNSCEKEKKLTCPYCKQLFSRRDNLKRHQLNCPNNFLPNTVTSDGQTVLNMPPPSLPHEQNTQETSNKPVIKQKREKCYEEQRWERQIAIDVYKYTRERLEKELMRYLVEGSIDPYEYQELKDKLDEEPVIESIENIRLDLFNEKKISGI